MDEEGGREDATYKWGLVVQLVKDCFEGKIPTAFNFRVLVVFPKDDVGGGERDWIVRDNT